MLKGILENIKSNVFILYVRTWCFTKTELVPKGIQQIIVKDKTKSKQKFCSSDVICNILAWVCFFYSTYLFCCIYWRKQTQNGNIKVNTSLAPASSCRMQFIHKNFHKSSVKYEEFFIRVRIWEKPLLASWESEVSFMTDLQWQE